jgi:hypothetical protein
VKHRFLFVVALSISLSAQSYGQPKPQSTDTQKKSAADERGTKQSPVFVNVVPPAKTQEETADEKRKEQDQSDANWWMVRLTGIAAVIGLIQAIVFGVQARRLKQTIEKMEEIAGKQTADVRASIAESTKAAQAMERIADSMAVSVESVKTSIGINREIADTQKLVTELQSRPYLSAAFDTAIFQDANHVFEVRAILRNHGNTPAYDVTFRAVAQIVNVPLPEDFPFYLPNDTAGASVSLIAPGAIKLVTRGVSERVPDDQIESIKRGGPPRC